MDLIEVQCAQCSQMFNRSRSEMNRSVRLKRKIFCSKECVARFNSDRLTRSSPAPNKICAQCDKHFYRRVSRDKLSKSGLYFCSRVCKDQAQRIGGIDAIHPSHYGRENASGKAAKKHLLRLRGEACGRCGYNEISHILELHHIDRDRMNNLLENLEILCPNCHAAEHFNTRSGKWKKSSQFG